uniref:Putative capsid protein n=1 Tax=viral metagenome TaxID=1070528 RepID=A0A6M3IFY1_9ZZZZ
MAGSGWITTSGLADSLDDVRSSARIVREQEGGIANLVEKITLGEGVGLSWKELKYDKIIAQAITETTELDNPQSITDSLITITPSVVGLETFITDRVKARISKKGFAKIGQLGQNAIQRKKDEDGLIIAASATGTADPGAGNTLASGYIAAASANITGNTTEPGHAPIRCVLHPFQIKDLYDELVAGVGTYVLTDGDTARVFKTGFTLPIAGCEIYPNGNITIDGSGDAKGMVFAQEGIIIVQGRAPRIVEVRNEKRGGGGHHVYHYDEYAYGERLSNWVYLMESDATAPTS